MVSKTQLQHQVSSAVLKNVALLKEQRELSWDLDQMRRERDFSHDRLDTYELGVLNIIKFLRVAAPAVYARYYDEERQQLNATKMGADADLVNNYNDTTEILNFIEDNPWKDAS